MSKSKTEKRVIKLGFDMETVELDCRQLVPLKSIPEAMLITSKFSQVVASIREVGLIEPPVVTPDSTQEGRYLLLDGHLRLAALKELGIAKVTCLVSTDDESFTYNKHVNRLSPVQEHHMILRAIDRGVAIEKIARALNVEVGAIVRKKNLLAGICPEAAHVLKDKMVASMVFSILRQMKPYRQIEAATLMRDANLYSRAYAQALLAATPKEHLKEPRKRKRIKGLDFAQMERMEAEMRVLQQEYNLVQESYGPESLNLTIARTYIVALMDNPKVARYLSQHHPEIGQQFKKIVKLTSLLQEELQSVDNEEEKNAAAK